MEQTEEVVTIEKPTPRPFKEIPGLWLKFGRMTEEFFADELPRASSENTFTSTIVYAFVAPLLVLIHTFIQTTIDNPFLNLADSIASFSFSFFLQLCVTFVMVPIFFYVYSWINLGFAKLFKGKGSFDDQTYLLTLVMVPCGILNLLNDYLKLIPIAGIFLSLLGSLAIDIYLFICIVRVFKVTHELTNWRAGLAALLPILLLAIPVILFILI